MRDRNALCQICRGNAENLAEQVNEVNNNFSTTIHSSEDPDLDDEKDFELSYGFSKTANKLMNLSKADIEKTTKAELPKVSKELKEAFDAKIEQLAQAKARRRAAEEYWDRFKSLDGFDDDLEVIMRIDTYA